MELNEDEKLIIVNDFLSGKSIRKISEESKTLGRTAINNILEEYASSSNENAQKIKQRKLMNKTHKNLEKISKYTDADLKENDIQDLYQKIITHKLTLTEASEKTNKSRDYIKSKIIKNISQEEIEKFEKVLKDNQAKSREEELEEFMKLNLDERKRVILNRLEKRVTISGRTMFKPEVLELKFERLKKYLLVKRNLKVDKESEKFTEDQFYTMLFETPSLLNLSLGNKIRPALENLDNNQEIGFQKANDIISKDASILGSSIMRTNLQIKILVDYGYLDTFLQKPRNFRNSPEVLYALIKLHNENAKTSEVFLSRSQLKNKYQITSEIIKEKYDIKSEYGNDEYFDTSR